MNPSIAYLRRPQHLAESGSTCSKASATRKFARFGNALALATACAFLAGSGQGLCAESTGLAAIKSYLVEKVTTMDGAAHDFVTHAQAYAGILKANGGNYDQAMLKDGESVCGLITKMRADYGIFHNQGYETIEGVTAGVKRFVEFDNDLDAGVPKAEASTDSPAANLVLKTPDGKVIVDHGGNLFHYVIEPALWSTKPVYLQPLSPEAAAKSPGFKDLPKAEVLTAASDELVRRLDHLLVLSKSWQPSLDECVGALVWMTPTLNGYFDDWKDSRYNPGAALGRYVAESRVLDMRGIMSSLQLSYEAIMPEVAKKDAALARRLEQDYAGIIKFIDRADAREKRGNKLTVLEIEEMAFQAKSMTDQLVPKLKEVAAILSLKLPPKPLLA